MNIIQKINVLNKKINNLNTELNLINAETSEKISYKNYNLPIIYLSGDMKGISKDDKVTLNYIYGDLSGTCTLKWQGSSSLIYPKKNYTISFDNKFEAREGWGEQKKYCLKANWIDFSHSRNVVAAKLWGQIVKSRTVKNDKLYDLPNGGAIDGFPVMVVINNEYQGLYSFNIPKDKWMFGMGDVSTECIIGAETQTSATRFKETAIVIDESDFSFEYLPDEDNYQWAIQSLNRLIAACMNVTTKEEYEAIKQYVDIDSAIDYFIFVAMLTGNDMVSKNYLLATFDGIKWYFSAYDLDTVFGNKWDGKSYCKVSDWPNFKYFKDLHKMTDLIITYDKEKLKTRYVELRRTVLSEANVMDNFSNFMVNIPKGLKDEEVRLWPGIPGTYTNNLSQIINYYSLRCKILDEEIENL